MNIILTGYSGFLGKTIESTCKKIGHVVVKLGRSEDTDLQWDFKGLSPTLPQSDIIIHCVGLAHNKVNSKYSNEYFEINYCYTQNLCEALILQSRLPKTFIFISSVSVYGLDSGIDITESHPTLPKTPYGQSKLQAEKYLQSWSRKHNVNLLIFRLPLLAGPNAPGNLGKMIKAIRNKTYLTIGNGGARKSMALAEDVSNLIAQCPSLSGIYNLTDGYHPSFSELETHICNQLNTTKPLKISLFLAQILSRFGDLIPAFPLNSEKLKKITCDLTFCDFKARRDLGWNPSQVLDKWNLL